MLFRHVRRLPILLASLLAGTLIGAVPPAVAQDTDPPTPATPDEQAAPADAESAT